MYTAFKCAAKNDHLEIVKYLKNKININTE